MVKFRIVFTLLLCISLSGNALANAKQGVWYVSDFGAKGDGKTLDTQAIQTAIDNCTAAGGGRVVLTNGHFLSGTIYLKSNVTLYIEAGASLLGSDSPKDYPVINTTHPAISGEFLFEKSLIYAEHEENIMIAGTGTINGRGEELEPMEKPRPHIILIRSCKNVKVRDIRLYNAAFWVQKYQLCNDLLIDGITVDSRENLDIEKSRFFDVPGGRNTDGSNIIDCQNVRIANCNIDSGDDGIVFKSFSRDSGCSNITVTNCVITTNASGIKIGTESAGMFRDFAISNCVIYDTRGAAIGLMTVDGASIERILVSNITLRNIKGTAIFLRVGSRDRLYQKNIGPAPAGSMKDILLQNIYGTDIERYGCSITGIPGARISNVVLDNIQLNFKQGESPLLFEGYEDRPLEDELTVYNTPELETIYPRGEMFGKLPAYGFYVRHTDNIEFNKVQLKRNEHDVRPALVTDDVNGLVLKRFSADVSKKAPALLHLHNTKDIDTGSISKELIKKD